MRGADAIAHALERVGARVVFTVSGNHVMSVFDALLETPIRLIHARHEARRSLQSQASPQVVTAAQVNVSRHVSPVFHMGARCWRHKPFAISSRVQSSLHRSRFSSFKRA